MPGFKPLIQLTKNTKQLNQNFKKENQHKRHKQQQSIKQEKQYDLIQQIDPFLFSNSVPAANQIRSVNNIKHAARVLDSPIRALHAKFDTAHGQMVLLITS